MQELFWKSFNLKEELDKEKLRADTALSEKDGALRALREKNAEIAALKAQLESK